LDHDRLLDDERDMLLVLLIRLRYDDDVVQKFEDSPVHPYLPECGLRCFPC